MYVCMYDELERGSNGVRSDSRGGKATTSRQAKLSQSGNCNSPKRGGEFSCLPSEP